MDAVLRQHVLVLNKNWIPINITTVYEAITSVFSDRAKFVDPETYQTFDFESWVENWKDAADHAKISFNGVVNCPNFKIVSPEIVLCTEYKGVGPSINFRGKPKFSRRNIFLRDRNVCQFCGKKFETNLLNIDHVVPKSRGGESSWTNIVLSCFACNHKKANRTPEEAGMRLLKKPVCPEPEEIRRPLSTRLVSRFNSKFPKSWETFLGKAMSDMYWSVELKD
jgi:hypothetical protein